MKQIRVAINGFGRIGRTYLRTIFSSKSALEKIDVVAINIGPANKEYAAHMFNYDTLMGTFIPKATVEHDHLIINGKKIVILNELDPLKTNWGSLNIDLVIESSGAFTRIQDAKKHIDAGARYVCITAPSKDDITIIIPGVNDASFNPAKDHIVSLGSCTTNAFIPMLHVINNHINIEAGFMNTVHAYTNSQVLLDKEHKDLRRSRAAALNIIPTTTGAAKLIEKIMPSLSGKIKAQAMRVPVGKVSIIDLSLQLQKKISAEELNALFKEASRTTLKNILDVVNEPLVSSDYSGNPHSVIIDSLMTQVTGNMINVFGWYDNEWGYSCRLRDFTEFLDKKLNY